MVDILLNSPYIIALLTKNTPVVSNKQQDMNADNFARYLEDPSLLYQVSYQELKSLSLQYPYCQNLHLLLFQKSFMDGIKEWEQNLEKAAAYSIDRAHLHHQTKRLDRKVQEADNFLLSEEFLELKSLDSLRLEDKLERESSPGPAEQLPIGLALEFGPAHEESPAEKAPKPEESLPGLIEEEEGDENDSLFEVAGIAPEKETAPLPDKKAEPANMPPVAKERRRPTLPYPELPALARKDYSRLHPPASRPGGEDKAVPPSPQPKRSFTTWIEQFQSPNVQVRLEELMESKKREKGRKKKKKTGKGKEEKPGVGRIAMKSIMENKEILSETLAELLAAQGEYQKAIEMYQRLILVFPKKSNYFAEKIENLKRK